MKKILFVALVAMSFSSCTRNWGYMSDANARLDLKREDLEISKTMKAEAKQTIILGVDWKRLFKSETWPVYNGFSIPIIGSIISNKTSLVQGYALYNLLKDNPGYDCIIYPKYMQKTKGFPIIYWKSSGVIECKLGKLK